MKAREERKPVKLSAQMRAGGRWSDIGIRNVSAHGMLLAADEPPAIGSFLEIRRGPMMLAVRTVWRDGSLFGVRAQDKIDFTELTTGAPAAPTNAATITEVVGPKQRRKTVAQDGEASRFFGRKFQFLFVLAVFGSIIVALGGSLQEVLYKPMRSVAAGFEGK